MRREDEFVMSHRPYAVDLTSLRWNDIGGPGLVSHQGRIDAAWFRRRSGVTVACVGTLWDFQNETTDDARDFLSRHDDGRYGGDCEGRWDGSRYWGAQVPDTIAQHLALLRPMLAAYPGVPDGYDGWWRF